MYPDARPRAVQITETGKTIRGWMVAVVLAPLLLLAVTLLDPTLAPQQTRNNIVGIAVLLFVAFMLLRKLRHDRGLVSTGEFAMAQVTNSEIVGGGRFRSRRYQYEFPDQLNRKWTSKLDWTIVGDPLKSLDVFYNPQSPQDHIVSLKACYQTVSIIGQ